MSRQIVAGIYAVAAIAIISISGTPRFAGAAALLVWVIFSATDRKL